MTINDVDESLKVTPTIKAKAKLDVPDETLSEPISNQIELNAISDALDLDIKDTNYTDEVGWLLEYAKDQSEDKTVEGLKWAIRELETKLGTPPFLEDRIKFMGRYAYLFLEGKKTSKELQKMTRGINVTI